MELRSCRWLAVLAVICCLAGCRIVGRCGCAQTVSVILLEGGMLDVRGRRIPLGELTERLDAMGVDPSTPVVVSVPQATPRKTMLAVTRALNSAGYASVAFRRPTSTDSFVNR